MGELDEGIGTGGKSLSSIFKTGMKRFSAPETSGKPIGRLNRLRSKESRGKVVLESNCLGSL